MFDDQHAKVTLPVKYRRRKSRLDEWRSGALSVLALCVLAGMLDHSLFESRVYQSLLLLVFAVTLIVGLLTWNIDFDALRSNAVPRSVEGDDRPAVLLLRTLSKPGRRLTGHPGHNRARTSGGVVDWAAAKPYTLLDEIARALRAERMGPVVTFQDPAHYASDAYLALPALDQTWRTLVAFAARASQVVLLLPDQSTGITQEVRWLCGSPWFDKLLVIMPPTIAGSPTFDSRWSTLRKRWRAHGMALPEYTDAGLVYVPKHDLSVESSVSLKGDFANVGYAIMSLSPFARKCLPAQTIAAFAEDLFASDRDGGTEVAQLEQDRFRDHLAGTSDDEIVATCEKYAWIVASVSGRPRFSWYLDVSIGECRRRFGKAWSPRVPDERRCINDFAA